MKENLSNIKILLQSLESIKINTLEIIKLENKITERKHTIDGFDSRLDRIDDE